MRRASLDRARSELNAALRGRRREVEDATLTRVYGLADTNEVADPQYLAGLRSAVRAAFDYGFAALEEDSERGPPVPTVLLVQARLGARHRVSLDTVLRRYHGGHTLFTDMLIEEAERCQLPREELKRLFRTVASSFDRLLAAVSEEHTRASASQAGTADQRRVATIERLLAGELPGSLDFGYDLGANHLGAIVAGPGGAAALRELGEKLDRRLLLVEPDEQIGWAWFGGGRRLEEREIEAFDCFDWPAATAVACGVPAKGIVGWRLTHRQAAAALPIAQRVEQPLVHYGDVALLASVLQDEVLSASLRQLYLGPLAEERDEGAVAKKTLRAYLAAAGNASSAAAALGVSRRTVASRLSAVEERLGRPVEAASAELETALRLEEIEGG